MYSKRLLLCLLWSTPVVAQVSRPVYYRQEVRAMTATSGELPFWFRANQYGIVPRGQTVFSARSAWRIDYRPAPKTRKDSLQARRRVFDWGVGLEGVGNIGPNVSEVIIPEGYVKIKIKVIEAWAGRRREIYGLGGDSPVGSGTYSWSGNALPIPKVQIGLPDYWPARSRLSVKASFSHGWFDKGFVQQSYLHQKSLYVRWGKPKARLKLYGGLNHQVQWAGKTNRLDAQFISDYRFPASFQAYWYAITGRSLNTVQNVDPNQYSPFDSGNRVGNHLGTIDVGAEVRIGMASALLYRQSIYEDGSLFYLSNIKDGLHGLRIRNNKTGATTGFRLNDLVLEYLNTYSQGGDSFIEGNPKTRGRDDYFNHGQYRDGWQYRGRTIGTPFIAPAADLRPDLPQHQSFNNNRVQVYHAGLSGGVADKLTVGLKLSYSRNAGTYQAPFVPIVNQQSALLTAGMRLKPKGLWLNAAAGIDRGGLYTSNTGFMLSLVKSGEL